MPTKLTDMSHGEEEILFSNKNPNPGSPSSVSSSSSSNSNLSFDSNSSDGSIECVKVVNPSFVPRFLNKLSEEKMEDIDEDEEFEDADEEAVEDPDPNFMDLDNNKHSRDVSSPPKEHKKGRTASTGEPSPNSRAASKPIACTDPNPPSKPPASVTNPYNTNTTSGSPAPPNSPKPPALVTPSKLDPIDISAKPQRPGKIYVKLLKALPENLASTATTPFTNQSNNPEESPVPLSAAVLFILKCIHQQTATPDETAPFTQADRAKALLRIMERKHMDNEDEEDFVSANDIDMVFQYYSRYTHTSPHALLRLKTNITRAQSTLISQDWSIATTVIGYHHSNNSSKTQQSLFSFFSQKNPSSNPKNRTETSSKLKSNHKNQTKSTKKNLIEEVIGPGPTDHIKNKTKPNTSKPTSISFASSTKPPKGGSTTPPTSPTPPPNTTTTTASTNTHPTSQASPQPGAFPTDFNSWKERKEDDNDMTFLYTNKAGNTVTTTPAAIATEVVNPKSKIQIPPNIMLKALILHQTSLAQAPPPSKTHQLKSPPKTTRTDISTPFLTAIKTKKARKPKNTTKNIVPDTLIPLRIRLSLPVPDKETASNPNTHVLQTLADLMAAAQEEDPTFCYLQWNDPKKVPTSATPQTCPPASMHSRNSLNESPQLPTGCAG